MVYEVSNPEIKGLNKNIKHSKNELGFRGPALKERSNKESIICVGGSTTECFYLSDGEDWPARLQTKLGKLYWVNNAGLDGHSTFGHLLLLKNHILKLKPNKIIFLVGCNDVAASQINNYEKEFIKGKKRLLEHSAIFNTLAAIKRAKRAKNFGMHHQSIDFVHSERTDTNGYNLWYDSLNLDAYQSRVKQLAELCISHGVKPIFCSQPSILSALSMDNTFVGNRMFQGESAMHFMHKLTLFNQRTQRVCKAYNLDFIDLEKMLEPSRDYYYDNFHFTTAGASRVSELIYKNLEL